MENPISDGCLSGSPQAGGPPGQQTDSTTAGATKKPKLWTFKVRSDFIQGTTNELRKRGRRLHNQSFEARSLYVYLLSFVGTDSPVPFPSMKRIQSDTGWGVSTIKKYRRELERAGLLVRRQRKENGRWSSNLYTLNEPPFAPSIQNQPAKNEPVEFQSSANKPPKRYQCTGRETSAGPEDRHEVPDPTRRSTGPSGAEAAAAANPTPSATSSGDTPEPPKVATPARQAEEFIKGYSAWSTRAKFSTSVVPRERAVLINFFKDNPRFTHRELLALMLLAWQAPKKADEQGLQPWWHCNYKSWRIKTFIDFLPNIQDEVGWQGTEKQIDRAFKCAEKFFPV